MADNIGTRVFVRCVQISGQQKVSKTDVVGVKVEPKAMSYCRGGYGREFELLVAWSRI